MKYYLPDHDEGSNDAQEVPGVGDMTAQRYAEKAADWMHARRGFWEAQWPITIVVLDDSGREHWFTVAREQVPEFTALECVPRAQKVTSQPEERIGGYTLGQWQDMEADKLAAE